MTVKNTASGLLDVCWIFSLILQINKMIFREMATGNIY